MENTDLKNESFDNLIKEYNRLFEEVKELQFELKSKTGRMAVANYLIELIQK